MFRHERDIQFHIVDNGIGTSPLSERLVFQAVRAPKSPLAAKSFPENSNDGPSAETRDSAVVAATALGVHFLFGNFYSYMLLKVYAKSLLQSNLVRITIHMGHFISICDYCKTKNLCIP